MFLEKLSVLNYKNLQSVSFDFSDKMNCFVGDNGVGKTNLLDAIYHLGMGKSYFNPSAEQNIRYGDDFYMLDGTFFKQNRQEQVVCSVKKGQRKQIKRNGKAYEKLSDHIGNFPIVIVSPSDRDLITESSEARRRFLDAVISQISNSYLTNLLSYNRILTQRNGLLKYFAENKLFDLPTLQIYNEQICFYAKEIYSERKEFLQNFVPIFKKQYEIISQGKEQVDILYKTDLSSHSMNDLLAMSLEKDRSVQHTTKGIHKDDLAFEYQGYLVKKNGSQGQQKTFLIALKFAQYHLICQKNGVTPILLLDDIFDKLDANRVEQIIRLVQSPEFGQVFLSDTHSGRTRQIVEAVFQNCQIFEIKK